MVVLNATDSFWLGGIGRNVIHELWSTPARPDTLLRVTSQENGRYPLGTSFFHTRDIHLTSIYHRKIAGDSEEFLLGFLSVLIIAMLSDMVQTVLLNSKNHQNGSMSKWGLQIAFLVDEFYHFRNVFKHLFSFKRRPRANRIRNGRSMAKTRIYTSLVVLVIAFALMAADVLTVYFTQQTTKVSRAKEYNVRGYQPIEPDRGSAQFLRRMSRQRPCVTPPFTASRQDRKFWVNTCVLYNVTVAHDKPTDTVRAIGVESYLHSSGSDHIVTFGDARISVTVRTVLFLQPSGTRDGTSVRVLFQTNLGEGNEYFRFLHSLFIHTCIEANCKGPGKSKKCEELVSLLNNEGAVNGSVKTRPLLMWHERHSAFMQNVTGYSTTFQIEMDDPFNSIDVGLYPLVMTSMIEEVHNGYGTYANVTSEERINGIPGLLVEEGRLAGLVLFIIVFATLASVLVVLRIVLKPVSLGAMAWHAHHANSDLGSEMFEGSSSCDSDESSNDCDLDSSIPVDTDDAPSCDVSNSQIPSEEC